MNTNENSAIKKQDYFNNFKIHFLQLKITVKEGMQFNRNKSTKTLIITSPRRQSFFERSKIYSKSSIC